jgi:hypothetical protein
VQISLAGIITADYFFSIVLFEAWRTCKECERLVFGIDDVLSYFTTTILIVGKSVCHLHTYLG